MDSISALDASTRLGALLDAVERGQEVVIPRDGRAVARLVPAAPAERPREAVAAMRALRAAIAARGERFTTADIEALRAEGLRAEGRR